MNKSGSIFLLLLLLVALSESFPKHYLVETEGAYKEGGGKDMGSFGCVDASDKIFKDGEIFNNTCVYTQMPTGNLSASAKKRSANGCF